MFYLVGNLLVLGLAGEEVEEVDDDSNDHGDLHVVVLPVGPESKCVSRFAKKVVLRYIEYEGIRLYQVKVCQARCVKIFKVITL